MTINWFRHVLASGLVLSALGASAAAAQADISGDWQGAIGGKLRIIIHLTRNADQSLRGILESPDQGDAKIGIDEVSFDGTRAYRFEWKGIGAVLEGEYHADGPELAGTWQQGGASVALTLRRPGAVASATLKPETRGSVALQPCLAVDNSTQALCGTYDVYENRATRTGRKIALNLMILPARSKTPAADAVLGFAGGPGQAATLALPLASFVGALQQQHDIVLIDQRGTGKSNPLRCPFNLNDARRVLERPEALSELSSCRTQLEKVADLVQYNTPNSSDDADDVRAALGYDQVDVIGGSYGSLAALDYIRRHGNHVRAAAIEGIVPPDYRLPLPFARTIQASMGHLFADCAADLTCAKDYPRLREKFESIVQRLDREPARFDISDSAGTPQSISLSRGAFVTSLRPLLYVPSVVSQLPYTIDRAYQGDWSAYAALAQVIGRAIEGEIARGMAYSVVCQEASPFISEEDIRRETAGTYLGDYDVRLYRKRCAVWPRASAPREFIMPVVSAVPTLLIAGEEDPATPAATARHAAATLRNSTVVAIPFGTHATSAACIDRLMVQFIAAAGAGGLDTACVNAIRNPPFISLEQVAKVRAQATGH